MLDKSIDIGMTTEQVTAAWGPPQQINETIRAASRDEQWVYPGPIYLYFKSRSATRPGRFEVGEKSRCASDSTEMLFTDANAF